MMMETSGGRGRSMFPFTESQWQELELQALIFKYISSGLPIPSDLIFYINNIPPAKREIAVGPANGVGGCGWGCFYQVGRRGAEEDPEPWRCRRTDGKKWRCSKEAYPDSKYCERHMHRGKNRSRKLVELSLSTSSTPASSTPIPAPADSSSPPSFASAAAVVAPQNQHLLFPCFTPSNPPTNCCTQPYKIHRNLHGLRKDINEYPFFTGGIGSIGEPNPNSAYLQSSDCTFTTNPSSKERGQFYFFLGSDAKSEVPMKIESEECSHKPRNFHLFIQ
ncbi:growth-regulating factor 1-like isoform X2 [Ananas comosus]|uniref:Growth-regulating factor n=1 Tax=Ananas comosus TaxID=4615 RepID=A0A6P5G0W2_ANACO|nr:growth-regulating factor 1-like isoform X2 [Ananas comosus]